MLLDQSKNPISNMKRYREEEDSTTMANWLILLSETPEFDHRVMSNDFLSRVFECKTCDRKFSSFQALGGHRASHKKPKLLVGVDFKGEEKSLVSLGKPKTHECSICGVEFAIGQALGGHMRRHRAMLSNEKIDKPRQQGKKSEKVTRRLDLNLTPFENHLQLFRVGKIATPVLDFFI